MKTRAFKKALSILCVLSMLLSVCVVCFAGTASAATTYTFNNSGKVYTADLESGAALEAPEAPVDHVEFLGWYDKHLPPSIRQQAAKQNFMQNMMPTFIHLTMAKVIMTLTEYGAPIKPTLTSVSLMTRLILIQVIRLLRPVILTTVKV